MPAALVKSIAKESGKSVAEVEKLWDKAKELAKEQGRSEDSEDFYPYVVGILKKMTGMGQNVIEEQFDYLFEESLIVQADSLCRYVLKLFNLRTQLHIWHLQTKSMTEHLALNDLYDAIPDLADAIAEGVKGLIGEFTLESEGGVRFVGWTPQVAVATLNECRAEADVLFEEYANNSILSGTLASISTAVNKAIYKIRDLNWVPQSGNISTPRL